MDKTRYVVNAVTDEFREMTDDEKGDGEAYNPDNLELDEDEVEFIHGSCGDIDAIFAYREGEETRLGIVHEGKVLVQANLSPSCVTALLNLIGRRHDDNMLKKG